MQFQRLALKYHPDKQPSSSSGEEIELAKMNFLLLNQAKHIMLKFLENDHHYTKDCKEFIIAEKERRDRKNEPLVSFTKLREHLDRGRKGIQQPLSPPAK